MCMIHPHAKKSVFLASYDLSRTAKSFLMGCFFLLENAVSNKPNLSLGTKFHSEKQKKSKYSVLTFLEKCVKTEVGILVLTQL